MSKGMKPATELKLTKRDAAALAKYATLVGLRPKKFLNRFLEDFLREEFGYNDRHAEGYLANFTFKNRRKAERVAAWMLKRYHKNNHHPGDRFEVGVIESSRGKFRIVATEFVHGMMCQISGKDGDRDLAEVSREAVTREEERPS